jgi:membrane protein
LAVYTVRRWLVIDRSSGLAASLALGTLLSVVPMAGVLLFFLRRLDAEWGRRFLERIARTLVPDSERADDLTARIVELGDNVRLDDLGPWGFLAVIVIAYVLFSNLERTFNEIWRTTRRRNIVAKFTMFYTLASLAPVVLFYSLAQPVLGDLTDALLVTPLLSTSIGLVLLNRLMPNTPVRWGPAIAGGLVSAFLFETSKWGFGQYLSLVAIHTYEGVYGTLAILPVFVVWSYLTWMLVLLGAEVAFVLHHVSSVAREGYVHPRYREERRIQAAPGRTAARLMLAICDHYMRREKGMTTEALDQRFQIGLSRVVALVDRLEEHGFVVALQNDGGYVPARPPSQIELQAVLHMFDAGDLAHARDDELARLYEDLDAGQTERVGELTFAQLVEREASPRAGAASTLPATSSAADDAGEGLE